MARIFRPLAILIILSAAATAQAPLAILDSPLPPLLVGMEFRALFHAAGGLPPYTWSLASGDLPEGLSLTPDGCLCGRPSKPGALTVTLKVEDSAQPAHSATKDIHAAVTDALLLDWLDAPKVRDNRIDGSVQVSNGSQETFDLTVIIVAIATDSHRETAIGYQHFDLGPNVVNVPISFGKTLPPGGYIIHADAIAEIPARKNILRQRLQTPQPLQIAVGP